MSTGEIASRMDPRRKWSAAEKSALLGEVNAEGGRVTLVARRHSDEMPRLLSSPRVSDRIHQ
jgi:hypothetical protein